MENFSPALSNHCRTDTCRRGLVEKMFRLNGARSSDKCLVRVVFTVFA